MAKGVKSQFVCSSCGSVFPKWQGRCSDCGQWNGLQEEEIVVSKLGQKSGYAGAVSGEIVRLDQVSLQAETVFKSGLSEFDRVLGGGLVLGSVVMIGGDPGIGKSTLLLQTIHELAEHHNCLYVSGEESAKQIGLRAQRLGLDLKRISLLSETQIEKILSTAQKYKPNILVIDSIQTLFTEMLTSAAGAVSQLRECCAQLVRFAKTTSTMIFLIGHVTKEGAIAGPRVLEHMVDTVLYFESEAGSRFRILRAVKNRFGPVNELGMFAMLEGGLRTVNNPSAIFLSRPNSPQSGSAVLPAWEGSRALLVELQALVDGGSSYARRVTLGLDGGRLSMLLAVLNRHGGISLHGMDVYANVVGGLKITETATDLALLCAVVSSLRERALPKDVVIAGEIGLSGELRPVVNGEARIKTAMKHGFSRAVLPKANAPRKPIEGFTVYSAQNLSEALDLLSDL